ncbi:hypothetical protein QNN00_12985 [Bacillus velezensis]|nr:hypothetical protein [Bacillus velezensis]
MDGQRHLQKLAELWSKGFEIDWTRLYREEKPRRMSLPTYPLQRNDIDTGARSSRHFRKYRKQASPQYIRFVIRFVRTKIQYDTERR